MSSVMIDQPGIQVRGQGTIQVLQSSDRSNQVQAFKQRKELAVTGQDLPPEPSHGSKGFDSSVQKVVSQMSDYIQNHQRDLQFKIDKNSGKTVITVLDSETKQVIRQIPQEELLQLVQKPGKDESLLLQEQA